MTLAMLLFPGIAAAQTISVPAAYQAVASDARLNPAVLYAIALTESGQSAMTAEFRPWPWTLSIDGEPFFYRTRDEARAALADAIRRQARQLGVGLFQIEYRFHADRFESPGAMLDPYANSEVAARIFSEGLAAAGGNVWTAIGLFHSATPELADGYRRRVARRLLDLVVMNHHGG